MDLIEAIDFVLNLILRPFAESSLYEDYKAEDGFTDEHYEQMIKTLQYTRDVLILWEHERQ